MTAPDSKIKPRQLADSAPRRRGPGRRQYTMAFQSRGARVKLRSYERISRGHRLLGPLWDECCQLVLQLNLSCSAIEQIGLAPPDVQRAVLDALHGWARAGRAVQRGDVQFLVAYYAMKAGGAP